VNDVIPPANKLLWTWVLRNEG